MKPKVKPGILASTKSKGKVGKKKGSGSSSPSFSLPEFLDVAPFDHERHCPRYCILVDRDPDEDAATSDELDPVQHELEQILLHNMKRQENITNQLSVLTDGDLPSTSDIQSECSKDRTVPQSLILRRLQSDLITTNSSSMTAAETAPKLKIRLPNPSTVRRPKAIMNDSPDKGGSSPTNKPVFAPIPVMDSKGRRRMYFWPQNHMPDKFWQFVSEHCDEIEKEDISTLKELLHENSGDRNSKFFRCPGLGKHYSLRWNQEDAKKSSESGKRTDSRKRKLNSPDHTSGGESSDAERRIPKVGSPERKVKKPPGVRNGHGGGDQYCLGPLTERLVQALIEEGTVESADVWMGNFGEVKGPP